MSTTKHNSEINYSTAEFYIHWTMFQHSAHSISSRCETKTKITSKQFLASTTKLQNTPKHKHIVLLIIIY